VPVPNAVIVVPEVTPVPEMVSPTSKTPVVTAVTLSVVPLILPVACAPTSNRPFPEERTATIVPAVGAVLLDVVVIVVPFDVIVVLATVWEVLMVYVPTPPVPFPNPTIVVAGVTPKMVSPTAKAGTLAAVTFSTVLATISGGLTLVFCAPRMYVPDEPVAPVLPGPND
jgi:hypothetical protein